MQSLGIFAFLCLFYLSFGLKILIPSTEFPVYVKAPPGTKVTKVSAWAGPGVNVTFRLHNAADAQFFKIDPITGVVTTSKTIDRAVNQHYRVIVVAYTGSHSEFKQFNVTVREMNLYAPQFEQPEYFFEANESVTGDISLFRAQASDNDTEAYNAQVTYALEPADLPYISIDNVTGQVRLLGPVHHVRNITFHVVARDSGSPQRETQVPATVLVNIISEPRDVAALEVTTNSAVICWSKPRIGTPRSYVIRYRKVQDESYHEINTSSPIVMYRSLAPNDVSDSEETETRLCSPLSNLDMTNYEVMVQGWDSLGPGRMSAVLIFGAKTDHCTLGLCQNRARCKLLENAPGYECDCLDGYTGQHCENYEPCHSNPCRNSASCRNLNSTYFCDCAKGFYGQDCSLINPCMGDHPPCRNNGTCISKASNSYNCECMPGYFGEHCEFYNPCVEKPCQNNSTCVNTATAEYRCDCLRGYQGVNCEENINECASNPCQNGGRCHDLLDAFVCECGQGFKGKTCEIDLDECASAPCQNGGTCHDGPNLFRCLCQVGYTGGRCEIDQDECASSPCANGGFCTDGVGNFTCTCPPGYSGVRCEVDLDDCASLPCLNGATCLDGINLFHCQCAAGFEGTLCHLRERCPEENMETSKGNFAWPSTSHGSVTQLPCPYGSVAVSSKQRLTSVQEDLLREAVPVNTLSAIHNRGKRQFSKLQAGESSYKRYGAMRPLTNFQPRTPVPANVEIDPASAYATRTCLLNSNGSVAWSPVDDAMCKDKGSAVAAERTGLLESLTENVAMLSAQDLGKVARQLSDMVDVAAKDPTVAQSMINVMSNILEADDRMLGSNDGESMSQVIMDSIHRLTSAVQLSPGQIFSLVTPNIALETAVLSPENRNKYAYKPVFGPQRRRRVIETDWNSGANVAMEIPEEALEKAERILGSVRLEFVSFRNSKLFRVANPELQQGETSMVISAKLGNVSIADLKEPVRYFLPHNNLPALYSCIYWDEQERSWARDGLVTKTGEDGIACNSTHMTAFSVLFDPTPFQSTPSIHYFILSVVSYIGSALSIVGLSITVFLYSLFKNLRRDRTGKILLNLCIALLLLNVAFVASSMASVGNHDPVVEFIKTAPAGSQIWPLPPRESQLLSALCVGSAIFIHYLVLAALAWMLVEAAHMYHLLVTVFTNGETGFMMKRLLAAWGIPFVVVVATALVSTDYYREPDSDFCRLSPAYPIVYYGAFLGPACLMLLVNCVVFVRVLRVILMQGKQGKAVGKVGSYSDRGVTLAQVRGAITVMALLGVTWIFGALAIGPFKWPMQYLFCTANSLQGFVIFIVRVVQFPEARNAWITFWRTGRTTGKLKSGYDHRHSSSPATTNSQTQSSLHSQAKHTLSTQSTHIKTALQPRLTHLSTTGSTGGATSDSESSTLPTATSSVQYRGWLSKTDSKKRLVEPKLNFRKIFGHLKLEPPALYTAIRKDNDWEAGRQPTLLDRHMSGTTKIPPSPGGQLMHLDLNCDPTYAIYGQEAHPFDLPVDIRNNLNLMTTKETKTRSKSADYLNIMDSKLNMRRTSSSSNWENSYRRNSVACSHSSSRRSSSIKEGTDTSWMFLKPQLPPLAIVPRANGDRSDEFLSHKYRPGRGSVQNLVSYREFSEPRFGFSRSDPNLLQSCADKQPGGLSRKFSMLAHDANTEEKPEFVVIAGQKMVTRHHSSVNSKLGRPPKSNLVRNASVQLLPSAKGYGIWEDLQH